MQAGLHRHGVVEVAQVAAALVALIQRAATLFTEHKRQVRRF